MDPVLILAVLIAAFVLAAGLVPLAGLIARRLGIVAHPTADRWHRHTIPKLGGAGIAATLLISSAVTGFVIPLWPLVLLTGLMFAIGLIDDLRPAGPTTKFVAQMISAAVFLYVAPTVTLTGWVVLDLLLAFFWIVGITNAVNLLDNIDGLAAGVAGIAAACFLAILLLDQPGGPGPLAFAMAAFTGAVFGFLLYNYQPASIFMGDSGSHLLGSFLAGATLLAAPGMKAHLAPVVAMPVLLLLIPIFDTTFVTLTRGLTGRSPFVGGRDHTSHRLVSLGISERRAVLLLHGLALVGGGVAVGLLVFSTWVAWALVATYVMCLALLGVYLGYVESSHDEATSPPLPSELTNRYRAYEVAIDVVLLCLAYYVAFLARFHGDERANFLPYFSKSLPLVVAIQLGALWLVGKYRQVWRTLGPREMMSLAQGTVFGVASSVIAVLYLHGFQGYSRSVFAFDALLAPTLVIGARIGLGGLDDMLRRRRARGRAALVYGAGRGGALAARELMQNAALGLMPIGFIDDDPAKARLRVDGLPVLGGVSSLGAIIDQRPGAITTVIISIRDLTREQFDEVCEICSARGVEVRRMRFALEEVAWSDGSIAVFPKRGVPRVP